MSAISLPAAPPILVPITMLPTIVAAGPGSKHQIYYVSITIIQLRCSISAYQFDSLRYHYKYISFMLLSQNGSETLIERYTSY